MWINNILSFVALIFIISCTTSKDISEEYKYIESDNYDYTGEIVKNDTLFNASSDSLQKNGSIKLISDNGTTILGQYKDNKKSGDWRFYDKKKVLLKVERYLDGFKSSTKTYKNGKFIMKSIYDPTF